MMSYDVTSHPLDSCPSSELSDSVVILVKYCLFVELWLEKCNFEKSTDYLSCTVYVLSSAITVEVVLPSDPPAAGQSYSLMCTVTGADSLNPTINYMYQWFKTTPSRTQVGTNSPTLTFDPLFLSDTGQYNCEVTVSSSFLSQDVLITSSNYEIMFSIASKYTSNIRVHYLGVQNSLYCHRLYCCDLCLSKLSPTSQVPYKCVCGLARHIISYLRIG